MKEIFLIIIISYIIGSVPFSLIFAKLFKGIDVRKGGSKNVGATNVLVTTGKRRAAITAVFFDIAKGFAVVVLAKILFGSDMYAYTAGFFAIVGHDFPFYLNFKGGKGVATTTGALIALQPFAVWFCILAYLISFAATRYLILSSLVSIGFIPIVLWMMGEGLLGFGFGILSLILALYVHREDISRLISGQETRFSKSVI